MCIRDQFAKVFYKHLCPVRAWIKDFQHYNCDVCPKIYYVSVAGWLHLELHYRGFESDKLYNNTNGNFYNCVCISANG